MRVPKYLVFSISALLLAGCATSWQDRVDSFTVLDDPPPETGICRDRPDMETVKNPLEVYAVQFEEYLPNEAVSAQNRFLGHRLLGKPRRVDATDLEVLQQILLDPFSFVSRSACPSSSYMAFRFIGTRRTIDVLLPAHDRRNCPDIEVVSSSSKKRDAFPEALENEFVTVGVRPQALAKLRAIADSALQPKE